MPKGKKCERRNEGKTKGFQKVCGNLVKFAIKKKAQTYLVPSERVSWPDLTSRPKKRSESGDTTVASNRNVWQQTCFNEQLDFFPVNHK